MNFWKKTTALLLALLISVPFAACGGKDGNSSSGSSSSFEDSSTSSETSSPDTNADSSANSSEAEDPFKLATPTLTMDNNVARWTAVENARTYLYKRGSNEKEKTTDGLYVTLTDGQTLYVKALAEDGYTDSDWAQITYNYTDPYIAPPTWARNPSLSSFTGGNGTEFDRFQGTEGYYEINLTAGSSKYYSFSVSQAGQYALYTNKSKTGLTIERYDASSQYITPTPYPAQVLDNGTLYSYVHCSTVHFNAEWRAVYKISSTTNGTITVRFVRVADALQEPERIVNNVEAKEIAGKAQDLPASFAKAEVPWTAESNPKYFYDEDYEMTFTDLVTGEEKTATGFYRYGEEGDENAPVLWAAINTPSTRYLNAAFSEIQYKGDNLSLHVDTDVDGNRYFDSYVDFIMNNGGLVDNENGGVPVAGDKEMLCYMNAANTDGLFPVNQELFEFLNVYTSLNPPMLGDMDEDDGVDTSINVNKKDFWLGACYYYVEQELGTQNNPIQLQLGENSVTLPEMQDVYFKLPTATTAQVTIVGANGVIAYIDGTNYGVDLQGFSVTVNADSVVVLKTIIAGEYTVTVSEVNE